MRIENEIIIDMVYSTQFIEDYDEAPKNVQKAFRSKECVILKEGRIPNSMRVKKLKKIDVWNGWVTQGHKSWRVLFTIEDHTLTFLRLVDHDVQDRMLKNASV